MDKQDNRDEIFELILANIEQILKEHQKDDRMVVPMFKTLDFILDRPEIQSWPGAQKHVKELLDSISREFKSNSVIKVRIVFKDLKIWCI